MVPGYSFMETEGSHGEEITVVVNQGKTTLIHSVCLVSGLVAILTHIVTVLYSCTASCRYDHLEVLGAFSELKVD